MDQVSDSAPQKRGRGRPPGSKNKPRIRMRPLHGLKGAIQAAQIAQTKKRGRPRKIDILAAQGLMGEPLALPPPPSFAEILRPNGESYFDGERPPGDEQGEAAGGGACFEGTPPPGAGTWDEWFNPDGRKFIHGRRRNLELTENTLQRIWFLGVLRTGLHEAASKLGVSHKTLQRFLVAHEVAREAWVDGHNMSKVTVRAKVFELAMAGNPQILTHLAKSMLGIREGAEAPVPDDESGEAQPEVENKGGQIKRIVFELVSPKN